MSIHHDRAREAERTRSLLQTANRNALRESGDRLHDAQEETDRSLASIGRQAASAVEAGLKVSEIAQLAGVSRAKIYELLEKHGGGNQSLAMRVLTELAVGGGSTVEGLADALELSHDQAQGIVDTLLDRELIRVGFTAYDQGQATASLLRITESGLDEVEQWIDRGGEAPRQMAVYVEIGPDEKEAIRSAAIEVLGTELFAVIEPDTTSDPAQGLELGFKVAAETVDRAVERAGEKMRLMRQLAEVQERTTVITTILSVDSQRHSIRRAQRW